jgi:hypothetical protein
MTGAPLDGGTAVAEDGEEAADLREWSALSTYFDRKADSAWQTLANYERVEPMTDNLKDQITRLDRQAVSVLQQGRHNEAVAVATEACDLVREQFGVGTLCMPAA